MIRNFFRHLLESIKSIKRNGWMTVASVSAVTVTLILVGIFLSVILNVSKLAKDVEDDVTVSVFVDIGTNKGEIDRLKTDLEEINHVKNVEFSSKEDEYKDLVDTFGKQWALFEGDSNPLYDVFKVSATQAKYTKDISKQAAKKKNVFKAEYGGVKSDRLFKISNGVRTWGLAASVLLLFVAIFLISNTIRITILSRSEEIQIMRLVGAKSSFIRWPFFLEGAWIGILGSIIPILIMFFGYSKVYEQLNRQVQALGSSYSLIAPDTLSLQVSVLMLVVGVVIGSLGSVISMRKFLKM